MIEENLRRGILESLGARGDDVNALLAYGAVTYDWGKFPQERFPWPDEPHVRFWVSYAEECERANSLKPLAARLPQLQFPVAAGMSENADYRAATRRAEPIENMPSATGLKLHAWERARLLIWPTAAGRVPVIVAGDRRDFVALVQAFTERNEPVSVPDSMGACAVSGYNNVDRIRRLRAQWVRDHGNSEERWAEEFGRIAEQPALYRDRFILVSEGPYSNVPAQAMGVDESQWLAPSLTIRIQHECTHYLMRRAFPQTRFRKNMQEELVADYAGIVAACGEFHADWFLKFCGIERPGFVRAGGRMENYRGTPPLSESAFRTLARVLIEAARNVAQADRANRREPIASRIFMTLALARLSLEEMAGAEGPDRIRAAAHAWEVRYK